MTRRVQARTLLELCVGRAGGTLKAVPKGTRVATFITEWAIASRELGGPITTAQYAEWWKVSERQAWRRRAAFKELFPELAEPQELADVVLQALDRREQPTPLAKVVLA